MLGSRELSYEGGRLNSGNARELSPALARQDRLGVRRIVNRHLALARSAGCHTVVMSREGRYHQLVKPESRELLSAELGRVLAVESGVLVVFRRFDAHAISAYCHRSGRVELADFSEWPENQYEIPRELKLFISEAVVDRRFLWTTVSVHKSPLEDILSRCIGGVRFSIDLGRRPNPSTNLYEAEVLRSLARIAPATVLPVRSAFKELPDKLKTPDTERREYYRDLVFVLLKEMEPDLNELSRICGDDFLPDVRDPRLAIPSRAGFDFPHISSEPSSAA